METPSKTHHAFDFFMHSNQQGLGTSHCCVQVEVHSKIEKSRLTLKRPKWHFPSTLLLLPHLNDDLHLRCFSIKKLHVFMTLLGD